MPCNVQVSKGCTEVLYQLQVEPCNFPCNFQVEPCTPMPCPSEEELHKPNPPLPRRADVDAMFKCPTMEQLLQGLAIPILFYPNVA